MKTNILKPMILAVAASVFSLSCKTNILPNVHHPTYEIYSNGTEKGYIAEFEVSKESPAPSAVILNKIQQKISLENKTDLKYRVKIIAQSQKIFGFKPVISDKEDGLIFKTDTADVYKPVVFKLKTK